MIVSLSFLCVLKRRPQHQHYDHVDLAIPNSQSANTYASNIAVRRSHNPCLARTQIIVTFDAVTRHGLNWADLSPRNLLFQLLLLFAVLSDVLVALVPGAHWRNNAWWRPQPLSRNYRIELVND